MSGGERPVPLVSVPEAALTFWPLLQSVGTFADWGWLGEVVRAIHELPDELAWRSDPLGRVRGNVAHYASITTADTRTIDLLRARCAELEERLKTVQLPLGVVHGDAHPGNVIVTSQGPILIDFDLAGHGPTMWDATVPTVFHRRFGLATTEVDRFFRAYDAGPYPAAEFDVLVDLQELLCASYVAARVAEGADATTELAVRVNGLAGDAGGSRWTPLR